MGKHNGGCSLRLELSCFAHSRRGLAKGGSTQALECYPLRMYLPLPSATENVEPAGLYHRVLPATAAVMSQASHAPLPLPLSSSPFVFSQKNI